MCNQLASDFLAHSVIEKATYLLEKYEAKYSGYMSPARWSLSELNELKGWLRRKIENENFLHALFNEKYHNLTLSSNGIRTRPIRVYDNGAVQEYTKVYVNEYKEQDVVVPLPPVITPEPVKRKPTRSEILAAL